MFKKILAPLDGSEASECSLSSVGELASALGSKIVLLTVAEPVFNPEVEADARVGRDLMAEVEKSNPAKSKAYLDRLVARFKAEGIDAEAVLEKGKPADMIIGVARKHSADLIVMSTHGRSGVTRWLLGSVTEKVVRHSPVPVLTISPPECRIEKEKPPQEEA